LVVSAGGPRALPDGPVSLRAVAAATLTRRASEAASLARRVSVARSWTPIYVLVVELFTTRARYTALALAFNSATALL
jgi:hypothetical protein